MRPEASARAADDAADRHLLERVARRDRAAFERLYERYADRVARYLLRLVGRREVVEEALNDVMLAVWRGAGSFAGHSRVSTWILGIAYRKGVDALRRLVRQPIAVPAESAENGEPPGDELTAEQLRMSLERALETLSAEQRAVVELTYYFGYSYREIAAITGCPVNTVKTRMFHARRRLKILLPALAGPLEDKNRERS